MQSTPDTHGSNGGGDVIPLSSVRDADTTSERDACDFRLLRDVADAASHAETKAEAAQAILDIVTEGLGLSSSTLALARESADGAVQLVPTASSGPQSPLLSQMPPIDANSTYEAAVVFTESQPHYVADVHDEGPAVEQVERTEEARAVGRWRAQINTKSYAVLPLCAGPRAIGVLTLQWPDSRHFDTHTTEMLETIAAIAAVTLDRHIPSGDVATEDTGGSETRPPGVDAHVPGPASTQAPGAESAAPVVSPARRERQVPVGPLRLQVTADGVLMPLAPAASSSADALIDLEVTLADAACAVWDASTPHPDIVALLVATFPDAHTADAMRDRLVQARRVCARQDMTLSQTIALLNGVVVALATTGVAVPVWLGLADARTGALTHCGSGDADVVVHAADGRTWTPDLAAPPLGSAGHSACEEDVRLLLPGDRVMVRLGDAELRIARP